MLPIEQDKFMKDNADKFMEIKLLEARKMEEAKRAPTTINMTNTATGRTRKVPIEQQSEFQKKGWEVGGRSENKPDTIINVGNIEKKARTKDQAFVKSTNFIPKVTDYVRKINKDAWDFAEGEEGKKTRAKLVQDEVDRRVKVAFPNAVIGGAKGSKASGWYRMVGDMMELIVERNK